MTKRTARSRSLVLAAAAALALASIAARPAAAQVSPGPLARVHENLEGITNCTSCHELGKGVTNARCLDCHVEIAAELKRKKDFHAAPRVAQVGQCAGCHRDHLGRDFEIIDWPGGARAAFPHAETGFPLEGAHALLDCAKCHEPSKIRDETVRARKGEAGALARTFLGLDGACASCHADPHAGELGTDCRSCHDDARWKPAPRFDHARTAFPLAGAHASVDCAKCHTGLATAGRGEVRARLFKGMKHDACTDCHADRHEGRMGADCRACHDEARWKPAAYPLARHEKLPLVGAHGRTECAKCHGERLSRDVAGAACASCHEDRVHKGSLGKDCEACHGVDSFKPATYARATHAPGRFPLEGAHAAVSCEKCHLDPKAAPPAAPASRGAPAATRPAASCALCHRDPHESRLGLDCARCHGPAAWGPVPKFDANAHMATRFPLDGAHTRVACARCHAEKKEAPGRLARLAPISHARCRNCHEDAHRGELVHRPDQGACESCHGTAAFRPAKFDRAEHALTRFPLGGAHAAVACGACHGPSPMRLRVAGETCGRCHEDPHRGQYGALSETGKCDACHDVVRFDRPLPFDHQKTRFPLEGAHASTACVRCHAAPPPGGKAKLAAMDCADCHSDPHLGQFSRRGDPRARGCEACHGTRSFRPADRFDHARTGFALDGKHAGLGCDACHRRVDLGPGLATVLYRPIPIDCAACHVDQHAGRRWREDAR